MQSSKAVVGHSFGAVKKVGKSWAFKGGGPSNGSRAGGPLGLYKKVCCCIKRKVCIGRAFSVPSRRALKDCPDACLKKGDFRSLKEPRVYYVS